MFDLAPTYQLDRVTLSHAEDLRSFINAHPPPPPPSPTSDSSDLPHVLIAKSLRTLSSSRLQSHLSISTAIHAAINSGLRATSTTSSAISDRCSSTRSASPVATVQPLASCDTPASATPISLDLSTLSLPRSLAFTDDDSPATPLDPFLTTRNSYAYWFIFVFTDSFRSLRCRTPDATPSLSSRALSEPAQLSSLATNESISDLYYSRPLATPYTLASSLFSLGNIFLSSCPGKKGLLIQRLCRLS